MNLRVDSEIEHVCEQSGNHRHKHRKPDLQRKRKTCQRQRYQQDDEFREKKLKLSTERYLNDKNFQARVRQTNKEKYHHVMILSIRAKPKMKSIEQMKSIRKLSKRRF